MKDYPTIALATRARVSAFLSPRQPEEIARSRLRVWAAPCLFCGGRYGRQIDRLRPR
jgi:hypothetical protein